MTVPSFPGRPGGEKGWEVMGSRSATELLQLPVRLHGIRLGQPVDLLLDGTEWRALGLVVLCGDESERFLAFAAADPGEDEIAVVSALLLLEDVEFYRTRGRSLRDLLGAAAAVDGSPAGEVQDLRLTSDGTVDALVVAGDGGLRTLAPGLVSLDAARAPAA
jgi:hypothetical protein